MVGLAIIGAGGMGAYYARLMASMPDAGLAYVCDTVEEKAKSIALKYGCSYTIDPAEAIESEQVDGVIITTPPFVRDELVKAAVENNKAIFCEKPLSINFEGALRLYRMAEGRVPFMMGFVLRWWPVYTYIKRELDSGRLGKPLLLWLTDMGNWERQLKNVPWRRRRALNAGIIEQIIHEIDMARYLAGEVSEVYAHGLRGVLELADYEDNALLTLKFRQGAIGTVIGSLASRVGNRMGVLVATKGTILFDTREQYVKARYADGSEYEEKLAWPEDPYLGELKEFVRWIKEGKEARATLEDGVKAQEIAEAAIKSMALGEPVKLPLTT